MRKCSSGAQYLRETNRWRVIPGEHDSTTSCMDAGATREGNVSSRLRRGVSHVTSNTCSADDIDDDDDGDEDGDEENDNDQTAQSSPEQPAIPDSFRGGMLPPKQNKTKSDRRNDVLLSPVRRAIRAIAHRAVHPVGTTHACLARVGVDGNVQIFLDLLAARARVVRRLVLYFRQLHIARHETSSSTALLPTHLRRSSALLT